MRDPLDLDDNDLQAKVERIRKEQEHFEECYYNLYAGTPVGQKVLMDELRDLGFFNELRFDAEEVWKHNYAVKKLSRMGIWNEKNLLKIVEALLSFNPRGE